MIETNDVFEITEPKIRVTYQGEYTFLWHCAQCGSRTPHVMRGLVKVCVPCALSKVVGGPTA